MSNSYFDFLNLIKSLPKTETHLHIEGALPLDMLNSLDTKFVEPKSWADNFKFKNFEEFDECLLSMACAWYTSPERYFTAAERVFGEMAAANVKYVEVSFASGMIEFFGIAGDEIAEALYKAAPKDMYLKIFMGIHHNGRPKKMEKVFEDCLNWKYLDGLDLHGNESVPIEDWTAPLWREAAKKGMLTKAHAGEFCGADNVRWIVENLGVKQIEHGVRAAEDESVLKFLAQENVRCDVCPTSNVKLDVCKDYASHPLKKMREYGILCTLNSDDPIVFNSNLMREYDFLLSQMGFSQSDAFDIAADGWRYAAVEESVRKKCIGEILAAKNEYLNNNKI